MNFRIGSLFSGYGGLELGIMQVLDAEVVWHCEFDKAPSQILAHNFPGVQNFGDVTKVDWHTVEPIDILCGGFPCQDVSLAGKRAGMKEGTRSGLWSYFAEAIEILKPKLVVIENVRGLLSADATNSEMEQCAWCMGTNDAKHSLRALGAVLGSLANFGFNAEWVTVPASAAGAAHKRERVFVIGYPPRIPTPTVADQYTDNLASSQQVEGSMHSVTLAQFVSRPDLLPTPLTTEYKQNDSPAQWERHSPPLATLVHSAEWGKFKPAIDRWETIIGRPAPAPTVCDGKNNKHRLNPVFVEWLMGLPEGHVTSVNITRNDMLKALGNGVVPQQAALALKMLLEGKKIV